MKISYVSHAFYPALNYGGPTISSYTKCKLLSTNGNKVSVITTTTNGIEKLDVKNATINKVNNNFSITYYNEQIKKYFSIGFIFNIYNHIRSGELIIIDDLFSTYSILSIYISFFLKKKLIVIPRGVLSKWSIKNKKKIIKNIWLNFLIRPFVNFINWEATSLLEKKQILLIFPNAKIIVIPNAINIEKYDNIEPLNKSNYKDQFCNKRNIVSKVIVSMGRLHSVKRFDLVIKSFYKLLQYDQNLNLLIAGNDAGEKKNLHLLIKKLKLENNVKFVGYLNFEQKVQFLKGADMFILMSETENFSNVVLEAVVCNLPIIISKGVPWGEIQDNDCGFQIESSEILLFDSMKTILGNTSFYKNKESFRKIMKKYDTKHIIKFTNETYRKVISA
ncbi:glycosyltransferase [Pelagibacterales bacterium]|nr:glycosyltransferase [Pelagibacterales bacterium]